MNYLKPFLIGQHTPSGLDVFMIPNFPAFVATLPNHAEKVRELCVALEAQVWNIRFSNSEHPTSLKGSLLLFANKFRPLGIMSLNYFRFGPQTEVWYFTDAMFAPEIRGQRLSRVAFKLLTLTGYRLSLAEERGTARFIAPVFTGDLAMMRFFYDHPLYIPLKPHHLEENELAHLKEFMQVDFPNRAFDKAGVLRGGWLSQPKIERERWPNSLATKYDLPADINFENGDVVHRNFLLNISAIPSAQDELIAVLSLQGDLETRLAALINQWILNDFKEQIKV